MATLNPASAPAAPGKKAGLLRAEQSPLRRMLRRLLHHRSAQVGMALLAGLVFVALTAGIFAPYRYDEQPKGVKPRALP